MTTDAATTEVSETETTTTETTEGRLPDDHPAAKALAKANREAAELRQQLKQIEDRDKSELQKAHDALKEKEAALADLPKAVRRQVLGFASKANAAGFLDPEDALAFLPDDVDLDDGNAVKVALDELAARKPHLVRKTPTTRTRPKPLKGDETPDGDEPKGKERAAAALRQLRGTSPR